MIVLLKTIGAVALGIGVVSGSAVTVYKVNELSTAASTHVTRGELSIHLQHQAVQTRAMLEELKAIRNATEANLREELNRLRARQPGN